MYQEFYRRYYFWCLEEWKYELKENLLRLKETEIWFSKEVVSILNEIPSDEVWNLCKALVKRFFADKLVFWKESFTEQDQKYVQIYFDMLDKKKGGNIANYSSKEEFLGDLKGRILQKTPRKVVRKKVVESLYTVLGDISEKHGTVEWVYETEIGPWKLYTWIDTGGRSRQLGYNHSIMHTVTDRLIENTSFLSWLGICGGETMWNNITNDNIDQVVSSLTNLVAHFVNAAPKLLEGIKPA